jgi:hypothetical protein
VSINHTQTLEIKILKRVVDVNWEEEQRRATGTTARGLALWMIVLKPCDPSLVEHALS